MNIPLFLLSFVVILAGCEFFTNGVEWAGRRFNLSEGSIGSVLAAVGTALPETVVPLIAILFLPGSPQSGEEIGVGAILGAPFMLTTLALFVCGLSVLLFRKRRRTSTLHINGRLIRRDLSFFLLAYSLAAAAAFAPAELGPLKTLLGFSLIPLYLVYVWFTFKKEGTVAADEDLKDLYLHRIVGGVNGGRIEPLPDPMAAEIDRLFRKAEPATWMILVQIAVALVAIIAGANIFVGQIQALANDLGINPLVLALVIAPIATELPEKFNSFLWIREGKDTYAIGNITGAMVFQSCFPVTIGILLTSWHIDLESSVEVLQTVAIAITLATAAVLYIRSSHKELHMSGLMLGGVMYALYIALVLIAL